MAFLRSRALMAVAVVALTGTVAFVHSSSVPSASAISASAPGGATPTSTTVASRALAALAAAGQAVLGAARPTAKGVPAATGATENVGAPSGSSSGSTATAAAPSGSSSGSTAKVVAPAATTTTTTTTPAGNQPVIGVSIPDLITEPPATQAAWLANLKSIGIDSVRIGADWEWISYAGPGTYDWSQLDQEVASV
ncbi:MAG: hypothetical protein ACLQCU_05105, partial [Acidimicrobiales bacterium]